MRLTVCFVMQAAGLAATAENVLYALDRAVEEATDAATEPTPQQQPLLQQLQQAAGVSAGLDCGGGTSNAALVAQLQELSSRLLAAAKLADLLHQWWQPAMQPERHAEAQLALAQAAATRSCAYLCCANLGGEGGPAAGEGAGSMRCRWVGRGGWVADGMNAEHSTELETSLGLLWACRAPADHSMLCSPAACSACRAVWYCGTACSHADWRAGHKRVCKALGAARRAAKEAVAAAADEGQQGS